MSWVFNDMPPIPYPIYFVERTQVLFFINNLENRKIIFAQVLEHCAPFVAKLFVDNTWMECCHLEGRANILEFKPI